MLHLPDSTPTHQPTAKQGDCHSVAALPAAESQPANLEATALNRATDFRLNLNLTLNVTFDVDQYRTHYFTKRKQELETELNQIDRQILISFPIETSCAAIQAMPLIASYHIMPAVLVNTVQQIRFQYGSDAFERYHQLLLCVLIQTALNEFKKLSSSGFPDSIIRFYLRHFEWICQYLLDNTFGNAEYYSYTNDWFLKDLNLCSLRMFPIGAQVIEQAPIARRFIIQHGLPQFIQASYFYSCKMKSTSPFYHVHLEERWVSDFNRTGWKHLFQILAERLKQQPQVKGVFGSSWFYDPQLQQISPGLLYLRKIPELGGAKTFKFGSSSRDIQNATRTSTRRKQLYQAGQYMPTSYILIWTRADLIRWADHLPS